MGRHSGAVNGHSGAVHESDSLGACQPLLPCPKSAKAKMNYCAWFGFVLTGSSLVVACAASKPAEPPPVPAEEAPAPPKKQSTPGPLNDAPPPAAELTALASPVSGPAQDDLPPPPPRVLEEVPLDLSALVEPPELTIDGAGHTAKIRSLEYTHDGRSLVTAGYDKVVRVWSAATGQLERTIRGEIGPGAAGRIHAASLSAGDQWLAVGGWLGKSETPRRDSSETAYKIRLVDFYSGEVIRLLPAHSDVVLSLAFSHRGARLVSGGGDNRAVVWDAGRGSIEHTLYGHGDAVLSVAWSPDDSLVATGSADRSARLWNANTGSMLARLADHGGPVSSVTFTPSGRSLLTGSQDGKVRLWDVKTGSLIKVLADLGTPVGKVAISPDGLKVLATTVGAPFLTAVYAITDGRLVARHVGEDNVVLAADISPNGKWAATAGGSDFRVSIWDLGTGLEQVRASGHGRAVWNVGFAKDSGALAWGHGYSEEHVGPYQLNGPLEHQLPIRSAALPFQVSSVPSGQLDFVRAVERTADVTVRTPTGKDHEELLVEVGGRRAATIRRSVTSGFVHRAFSLTPDGKTVVSGGDNGALSSFNTQTGRLLHDFRGHSGDILAVAVSPDGRQLVSGASDQTVRLWDLASGELLLTVFHAKNREWVAFTPAGYYASSAFGDSYVGWHAGRGPERSAIYFRARTFASQLRHERVVLEYLGLGNISAAILACNRGLPAGTPPVIFYRFTDLPQFAPPDVYYLDPGSAVRIAADRIEVTARAYSPGVDPTLEMTFLVNGRPVDERWLSHVGRPVLRVNGRQAEIRAVLPLPEKTNRITVIARNRYAESEPVGIDVERTGGPGELEKLYQPDLYVLSVGVSNYGSPHLAPLSFAHKDAEAVAAALQKNNKNLYSRVAVRLLTQKAASQTSILDGIRWLGREASQKDLALIFLSGYASRDAEGEYFFLPQDADPKRLKETGVRWSDLRTALEALPARVVLLLDSSHAGALTGSTEAATSPIDLTELVRTSLTTRSDIVLLTSSTGNEASYESAAWGHGAFTQALLEGLNGQADYDRDRKIYVRELDHFVSRRVDKLTGGRQHPTTEIPDSLPNFALSQVP